MKKIRNTIRFKLFLTFITISFIVVGGMYAFTRWSFHTGFSEFVESRQNERIKHVIEGLTDLYSNEHGWNQLANDKAKWIDVLVQASPRQHSEHLAKDALDKSNRSWPPVLPDEYQKTQFKPFEWRLMLLDADQNIIFGNPEFFHLLKLIPIHVKEETVGYLGLVQGNQPHHKSETIFLEKQLRSYVWITFGMILMSAALAYFLAFRLGKPLKKLTNALNDLAGGRYDVRLRIDSNDEFGKLSRDFNEMASTLEQAEQARRRWVADISHELRTPLAVLHGELEALQDGIRPLDSSAVELMFNDVKRLNRLIDDLYQLAISDQGALNYRKHRINPVSILEEDLESLRLEFQKKNIFVVWRNILPSTVKVYGDSDRLSQLFRNLLMNSANYTDCNGQLIITISYQKNRLQITFSDSAPGVPEEDLPKLFDRFYRHEKSRINNPCGAGLGLAICGNIVKAHNGSITAHPSPLNGLSIQLELPID